MARHQYPGCIIGVRDPRTKQGAPLDHSRVILGEFHNAGERRLVLKPAAQALSVPGLRSNPRFSAILNYLVPEPGELLEGQGRFVVQRDDPTAHTLRPLMTQYRQSNQRFKARSAGYPR